MHLVERARRGATRRYDYIDPRTQTAMGMTPAWIHLECPGCQEVWESTLDAVPELGGEFQCPYCRTTNPVAEFVRTKEGLSVLEEYQQ